MINGIENIMSRLNEINSNLKPAVLNVFAVEWEKSIRANFVAGGRPGKWKPRRKISKRQKGTNLLVISGALKNYRATVELSGSRVILVSDPRAREYAEIHDKGGVIQIPSRVIRHRVKRYKDGSRRTVFAGSRHKKFTETQTKSYSIIIPKREHTNIPESDIPRILNAVKQVIKL